MRAARPARDIPPPMELQCLKVLWTLGEGNVRAVQEALAPQHRLAYTTVMTLLERLTKKGGLSRRKAGRSFIYKPLLDRDTMRRRAVSDLMANLFEGSPELLVAYVQDGGASVAAPQEEEPEQRLDTALL